MNWQAEPFYVFWCRHLCAQWTARPFMEAHMAQQRAAHLEAEQARVERLKVEAQQVGRIIRDKLFPRR
jgi:hypothetical protein